MDKELEQIKDCFKKAADNAQLYITSTEHWPSYFKDYKAVAQFINCYPDDYEERMTLSVTSFKGEHGTCKLTFDGHPTGLKGFQTFFYLDEFRDTVKKNYEEYINNDASKGLFLLF